MRKSILLATVFAFPLGLTAWSTDAADLVATAEESGDLDSFVEAVETPGLAEQLTGEGPFTVFAPTDQAFESLSPDVRSALMDGQARDHLATVLKHHVVQGQELAAKDVIGGSAEVETLSGDQLTVDGQGAVVVLVPTGLTLTRVGDEVFVERSVAAVPAPAVTVAPAGQDGQSGQGGSKGGQQAATPSSSQPTGSGGTPNPLEQPQTGQKLGQEAQPGGQAGEQQSGEQQAGAQSPIEQRGDSVEPSQEMTGSPPRTPPQTGAQGRQQAEAAGEAVTRDGGQGTRTPMAEQPGTMRAALVVTPDIQADNGVIHAIDQVIVPEAIAQQLDGPSGQGAQDGQAGGDAKTQG